MAQVNGAVESWALHASEYTPASVGNGRQDGGDERVPVLTGGANGGGEAAPREEEFDGPGGVAASDNVQVPAWRRKEEGMNVEANPSDRSSLLHDLAEDGDGVAISGAIRQFVGIETADGNTLLPSCEPLGDGGGECSCDIDGALDENDARRQASALVERDDVASQSAGGFGDRSGSSDRYEADSVSVCVNERVGIDRSANATNRFVAAVDVQRLTWGNGDIVDEVDPVYESWIVDRGDEVTHEGGIASRGANADGGRSGGGEGKSAECADENIGGEQQMDVRNLGRGGDEPCNLAG